MEIPISEMIDVPTPSSVRARERWLYIMGKYVTREDVLGIRDGRDWYSVLPLSRVWDWRDIPYDPPFSANDWYILIQGMPDTDFKYQFLSDLAYSLIGERSDDAIDNMLDMMEGNHLTLVFDSKTNTYDIV